MATHNLLLLPGDGIGPEVMAQAKRVIDFFNKKGPDKFTTEEALVGAISASDFVLLGELHDNPDHHLLQARLMRALARAGRQPALALEMLSVDQQQTIDAALVGSHPSPQAFAEAVDWAHSGWPPFALYRPLLAVALEERWPLLAADLARGSIPELLRHGPSAARAPVKKLLEHAGRLTGAPARVMEQELHAAHCGQLTEAALASMMFLQRARDAQLALRVLSADAELSPAGYEQGVVLVAGIHHVRNDVGVPLFLSREAPQRRTRSVGFLEVAAGQIEPTPYAARFGAQRLPFDYVVFTPGVDRPDPCRKVRGPERPGEDASFTAGSVAAAARASRAAR